MTYFNIADFSRKPRKFSGKKYLAASLYDRNHTLIISKNVRVKLRCDNRKSDLRKIKMSYEKLLIHLHHFSVNHRHLYPCMYNFFC